MGFAFSIKCFKGIITQWRCKFHNRHTNCKATIHQEGDVFSAGPYQHLYPAQQGIAKNLHVQKKVKSAARLFVNPSLKFSAFMPLLTVMNA